MQHLKEILTNAAKLPLTWYLVVAAATLGLFFAPIQGKWSDKASGQSLIAMLPLLAAGEILGSLVGSELTMMRVRQYLAQRLEYEELAHEMNTIKEINQQELRQISGEYTLGEMQVEMGKSQERITLAMANSLPQIAAANQEAQQADGSTPAAAPELLPEEDLAKSIAYSNRSTVVIAPSGCGKTSLIRSYIHETNERYNSLVDFTAFDFKGDDDGFCGLEKSPDDYFVLNGHESVPEFYRQIQILSDLLKEGRQSIPVRWIADEMNNGLSDAVIADKLAGRQQSKNYETLIPASTYKLATQGRTKDVIGVITSHSPQVKDLKLNTSILQSLWLVALGIPGNYGAIEQVLDAKVGILTDQTVRTTLSQKFDAVKHRAEVEGKVIALTNVPVNGVSRWRLILLPDYSKDRGEIKRSAANQTVAEIIGQTEQAEPETTTKSTVSMLEDLLKQEASAPHEDAFYADDADDSALLKPSEFAISLIKYCHGRGARLRDEHDFFSVITLRKNWAESKGFNADSFLQFLHQLTELQLGEFADASCKTWKPTVDPEKLPD